VFLTRCGRWIFRFLFASLDLEKKSALTALSWGVWVICARSFDSSPAYVYPIAAARWFPVRPETFWGGLMSLTGTLQLYGLIHRVAPLRMGAAIFASTLWLSLGLAFAIHNPRGGGMIIYGLFALANAALYFQVGTGVR
jgi:hypothetical protein